MILVAIYIPSKTLPHIFGEDHEGQTINLGGKCIYTFEERSKNEIHLKDKKDNPKYIENFWLSNIQLVSAIVGANGTGKTSLLRCLITEFSSTPASRNCIIIYEDIDNLKIINETSFQFNSSYNFQLIKKISELNENFLYYSPNLDYDVSSIHSPISLVSYHENNLVNYYLSNIKRHLFFLKDKSVVANLKKSYEDFPFYDKLVFLAKPLYKSDFEKVYIQSTLGNKLFKIRNNLLNEVEYSNNKSITINENEIIHLFEKSESIQDELEVIWHNYTNSNEDKQQFINGGDNFLKDIEVNILSYLVLEDTFALDGDYGFYPLSNILQADKFEEKLTHFLRKFITQTSENIYNSLNRNNISIDTSNFKQLKSEVQKMSNPNREYQQVNYEIKARNVLKQIDLLESIYDFYTALVSFQNQKNCKDIEGGFEATIENSDVDLFNKLIDFYQKMLSHLKWSNRGGVLEIKSEKKLSTGEKSLLDFYASLYDYLKRWKNSKHMYSKNCILLLDEPEQGFHPFWKKKFVNALITTLPLLFEINKTIENIQIIITTHDPLTLSDIPNTNIVYLKKEMQITKILDFDDIQRPTKTFGANISDLLADSFFVNDGLIGDFAKEKIENIITELNLLIENKKNNRVIDFPKEEQDRIYTTINIIDEPIIKNKLIEMYNTVFEISIENEINNLEERLKYLKNLKNN